MSKRQTNETYCHEPRDGRYVYNFSGDGDLVFPLIAKAVRKKYPEVKLVFDNLGASRLIKTLKDSRADNFYGVPERFTGSLAHEYNEPKGKFGILAGKYAVFRDI
ncbi:MAG: hypothetical protein J6Z49_08920 [Kiritimatiellae bacterium]|nr:hypothetical protein [Kiritimatiellia bacterium]